MVSAPLPSGRRVALGCALGALLTAAPAIAAEYPLAPDDKVVGNLQEYVLQPGDLLADLARKFDVGYTEMLAANPGVDPWVPPVGRKITIPTLYILPDAPRQGIVINLGERRLYYFPADGGRMQTYPIGIGAIGFDTPHSATRVVRKEDDGPTWVPPPSIRAEQPDLPIAIGPGPDNPLGAYALRLGWKNYLIHGTNKPDGVGRNVSHGCIHLYPEDIEKLLQLGAVAVGTPVQGRRSSPLPRRGSRSGLLRRGAPVAGPGGRRSFTEQPVTPAAARRSCAIRSVNCRRRCRVSRSIGTRVDQAALAACTGRPGRGRACARPTPTLAAASTPPAVAYAVPPPIPAPRNCRLGASSSCSAGRTPIRGPTADGAPGRLAARVRCHPCSPHAVTYGAPQATDTTRPGTGGFGSRELPGCVGGQLAFAQLRVEADVAAQALSPNRIDAEHGQHDRQVTRERSRIHGAVEAYSSAPPCSISPQAANRLLARRVPR